AARDTRAAAFAHPDVDDSECLQRAQGVARDDAADPETFGEFAFGAEEFPGTQFLCKERIAHARHNPPGKGIGAPAEKGARGRFVCDRWMQAHDPILMRNIMRQDKIVKILSFFW